MRGNPLVPRQSSVRFGQGHTKRRRSSGQTHDGHPQSAGPLTFNLTFFSSPYAHLTMVKGDRLTKRTKSPFGKDFTGAKGLDFWAICYIINKTCRPDNHLGKRR